MLGTAYGGALAASACKGICCARSFNIPTLFVLRIAGYFDHVGGPGLSPRRGWPVLAAGPTDRAPPGGPCTPAAPPTAAALLQSPELHCIDQKNKIKSRVQGRVLTIRNPTVTSTAVLTSLSRPGTTRLPRRMFRRGDNRSMPLHPPGRVGAQTGEERAWARPRGENARTKKEKRKQRRRGGHGTRQLRPGN